MTFVLLTAGIDLSVGSNMYVSAMTVGYFLMLPGMQGDRRRGCRHRRRPRRGCRLRRDQRLQHRRPPHHALPCDAGDDGRRAWPCHRGDRVLRPRLSGRLHQPRRLVGSGPAGADHRLRDWSSCRRMSSSPAPQYGRQLYAVGNDLEGAKRAGIRTDRILFSVYVISGLSRSAWRHHADRAGRAAQPDLRRRQGVRRHYRRGPRRDEPLRRRRHGLRRGDRLGPRPDGPGRHDLREGQPLPAADRARRHHLSRRLLRQPAGIAARAAEAAVHSRGRSETKRGGRGR